MAATGGGGGGGGAARQPSHCPSSASASVNCDPGRAEVRDDAATAADDEQCESSGSSCGVAMGSVGVGKPLRLKDLLELDCESCSAAGFRCYPRRLCVASGAGAAAPSPMRRRLAEEEAETEAEAGPRFRRPSSLRRPRLSHLSRRVSRRLRGGFWRRREENGRDEPEPAEAKPDSPVAAAASGCSSSDSETTSESGSSSSTERKSESDLSSASSGSLHLHSGVAAAGAEHEEMKRAMAKVSVSETDDKEQLSPVGVMDFPFDDGDEDGRYDDGGGGDIDEDVVVDEGEGRDAGTTCSPYSFSDSLAQLQRRKKQLEHKIQRFGSSGELVPENLEARFAASDSGSLGGDVDVDDPVQLHSLTVTGAASSPRPNGAHRSVIGVHGTEADERSLLLELLTTAGVLAGVDVDDGVSGRLLLDFFMETTSRSGSTGLSFVRLAKAWLGGAGSRWGLTDVLRRREDMVAEMERSRRWTRAGEEEVEVGAAVAGVVVDELVDELVRDLAV